MKKVLLFFISFSFFYVAPSQNVYSDVASIFYKKCAPCHNENSHAPSFLTYSQTLAHASTIAANLNSGYMPPWSPDTSYSRFSHERLISLSEKEAILNWIAQGALKGDTTLAPPPPTFSPYQLNGTPDLELSIPSFVSNASTDDSYVCFSLPSGLTQNRILKAYEIIPGNASIVHHVIANVDTIGNTQNDLSGQCFSITGNYSIGGYAPGAPPTVFPSSSSLKMGINIKSGSKIVLQIHYPAGTAGKTDNTKIRIYFYPPGTKGVRSVFATTPLQNWALNIPANTIRTFTAQYPFSGSLPFSVSIFGAFPHSHKLARSIENYAIRSNDKIPLVRINNWDFNWQGYYTFRHLTKIPAGYKLFSKHIFDNTTQNPNIIGSPVDVSAGTNTTDEMLYDSFQWLMYEPGDEFINLDSLLAIDPLTSITNQMVSVPEVSTFVYPNPFTQETTIKFLNLPEKATFAIFNSIGQLRLSVNSISHGELVINRNNLASGIYFFVLRNEHKIIDSGKLLIE